jgi:hypothetical protein
MGRGNKSDARKAVEAMSIGECISLSLDPKDRKRSTIAIRQMILLVEKETDRWYARRAGQETVQIARVL